MLGLLARHIVAVGVATTSTVAYPQSAPPIYVLGQEDDQEMRACGLSYLASLAAVQAALRYNRVSQATKEDWFADKALRMYANVGAG